MNCIRNIRLRLSAWLCASIVLAGCVDKVDLPTGDVEGTAVEIPSLQFDIAIPSYGDEQATEGETTGKGAVLDHGEEWESYIDPSKFRVLFFDNEGNYLFETDRRHLTVISKDKIWSGQTTAYRVTIPDKYLFANAEHEEAQVEAIKKAILEEGFKVAVLANWPTFVEDDRRYDEYSGDPLQPDKFIPTDLDFAFDPAHEKENSKIAYLSHCIYDNVYGDYGERNGSRKNLAYEHLCYLPTGEKKRGQMGVYSVWVKHNFNTQKEVRDFLRGGKDEDGKVDFLYEYSKDKKGEDFTFTQYDVTRTVDANNVYTQRDLWRVWNFSAGEATKTPDCPTGYNPNNADEPNQYWTERCKNVLCYQLDKLADQTGKITQGFDIDSLKCSNTNITYHKYDNNTGGYLTISNNGQESVTEDEFKELIKSTASAERKERLKTMKENAIHFRAYGEGGLRIKCTNNSEGKEGKIVVIYSYPNNSDNFLVYPADYKEEYVKPGTDLIFTPPTNFSDVPKEGYMYIINPESNDYADTYIIPLDDEINVYEIEYLRDRITYYTSRQCIMPSVENPIPMYGVQNFDPIGKYIELLPNKSIFNLSDVNENKHLPDGFEEYNYKDVYLLRSLAKVELRLKKEVFKDHLPQHVYMNSMNRSARCEPKDPFNPTEWIWYGSKATGEVPPTISDIPDTEKSKFVGVKDEFQNIINYGPLYDTGKPGIDPYRDKISWFYGIWKTEFGWNWNGITGVDLPATSSPNPRIFNTRIDRSSYTRFHRVPDKALSDGDYIRYIMYVPEKNIDDADDKGDLTASPKVMNVQLRFTDMNDGLNLEDKNCYRIYFSDYKENGGYLKSLSRSGYNEAERRSDKELLKRLQPVMRNCHYIFTINSINNDGLGINFTVCGAASREASFDFN